MKNILTERGSAFVIRLSSCTTHLRNKSVLGVKPPTVKSKSSRNMERSIRNLRCIPGSTAVNVKPPSPESVWLVAIRENPSIKELPKRKIRRDFRPFGRSNAIGNNNLRRNSFPSVCKRSPGCCLYLMGNSGCCERLYKFVVCTISWYRTWDRWTTSTPPLDGLTLIAKMKARTMWHETLIPLKVHSSPQITRLVSAHVALELLGAILIFIRPFPCHVVIPSNSALWKTSACEKSGLYFNVVYH